MRDPQSMRQQEEIFDNTAEEVAAKPGTIDRNWE
jgi:hypothetical protein